MIKSIQLQEHLRNVPDVEVWADLLSVWDHATSDIREDWAIPNLVAVAMGAELPSSKRAQLAAAVGAMQLAIILVDDILDDDVRGTHHKYGAGPVANMSLALSSMALEMIDGLSLPQWRAAEANRLMVEMNRRTAVGQHIDTMNLQGEDGYWRTVMAKSTPFYGMAFALGAIVGGGTLVQSVALRDIGLLFGEIVQIKDDLMDMSATPANPDWLLGRCNICIMYGKVVPHEHRDRFLDLLPHVDDNSVLREAQQILIKAGVLGYCFDQIEERQKEIVELLNNLNLVRGSILVEKVKNMSAGLDALTQQLEH